MFTCSLRSIGTILKGAGRLVTSELLVQGFKRSGRTGTRADPATSERIRSPELVVQGWVAFVATSKRIRSLEQVPSSRVQGL
jgi:hypothetical protein